MTRALTTCYLARSKTTNTPSPITTMTRMLTYCSFTQHTPDTTPVWISLYHVMITLKVGMLSPSGGCPIG